MERQVRIIMEIREDDNFEEMENDDRNTEISETVETTGENDEAAGTEGEETGEEGIEEAETLSSMDESYDTQILVEVDTNHELSDEINSFSYETVVLTIIVIILGIMAIGGFSHE